MYYHNIVDGKLRGLGRSPLGEVFRHEYMKRGRGWVDVNLSEPVISFIKAFFECPSRFSVSMEKYSGVASLHTVVDKQNGLVFTIFSEYDHRSYCSTNLTKRESTRWMTDVELTVVFWLIKDYYDERKDRLWNIRRKRKERRTECEDKAMREHLKSFYCGKEEG